MLIRSLALILATGSLSLAQTKPEAPKEVRPSQEAITAKDSLIKLDLAYGKHAKQKLDVYAPANAKGSPVVIFVHGGEWTKGDKSEVSYKPKLMNESGFVFVSVNYRLSPEVKHPAHVSDIATGIRWVKDNIQMYGGDPNKIVLMGHSAGCHLVTLVTLDPKYLAEVKLKPTDLRGVVAWSGGMYDLADRAKGPGTYPPFIKQTFGDDEKAQVAASPVVHIGKAEMPSYLFVSIEKGNASHQAAERMVKTIVSAKGSAEGELVEGRTHFQANHLVGSPGDTTGRILTSFINRVTR